MQPSVGRGSLPVRLICPPLDLPKVYLHTSQTKHSRVIMALNKPLTGTPCGLPWSLCAGCHGEGFPWKRALVVAACQEFCSSSALGLWTSNTHCQCPKYKNHKMPETSLCSFLCQRQLCRTDWTSKRVSQVSLILLHCGRCRSIQLTTGSTATLSQGHSQGQVILQWILSCFLPDYLWIQNLQAGKEIVFFVCCYLLSKYFILQKQNVDLFLQFLLLLWRFSPCCDSQYEDFFLS